ncbi:MAG: DUF721 domain-containing protein [Planctomycetota bacterium]
MEKRHSKGPVPLADAIQGFLREAGLGSRTRNQEVFEAWKQAFGERPRVRPVSFRSGDLTIEVGSAALRQELKSFTADNFRRKANQILGDTRIRRVIVKPMS